MTNNKLKMPSESILLNEIELLLAEKRTYFSVLRTGIAVVTLPLTFAVFLLATKDLHNFFDNKLYVILIVSSLIGITIAGVFMTVFSVKKIKKIDCSVKRIESENKRVENIIV